MHICCFGRIFPGAGRLRASRPAVLRARREVLSLHWACERAGNARKVRSQETRELELSQRRMRSPWREPQQSAGRRARPESRGVAQAASSVARLRAPNANKRRALRPLVCTADNGWIASFGAPLPSLFFARAAEFWTGLVVAHLGRHRDASKESIVVKSVSEAI